MALKTVIFWGQSNMEGRGSLTSLVYGGGTIAPHLNVPVTSPVPADGQGAFGRMWWYVDDWDITTPIVSTSGTILEFTYRTTTYPAPANRNFSVTVPEAVVGSPPLHGNAGLMCGCPEFLWRLGGSTGEQVLGIKLSPGATVVSRTEDSTGGTSFSWFDPLVHNSWSPGYGNRLAKVLIQDFLKTGAVAAANSVLGETIEVVAIVGAIGETDSQDLQRAEQFGENLRAVLKYFRTEIANANLSAVRAEHIPCIMAKVRETDGVWTHAATVNAAMVQIATDDPYFGLVDTDDISVGGNTGVDTAHFDAAGQILLHKRFYSKYLEVIGRPDAAADFEENRATLLSLRNRVKDRYEKNQATNDAEDSLIDQFINDAQREIFNDLGDHAWFLRNIETMTLTAGPTTPVNLPRVVKRILRIERDSEPGTPVGFRMLGFTDEGRIQILMDSFFQGDFRVHYMSVPRDMTKDSDVSVIPPQFTELVVLLTCRRLAQVGRSMELEATFHAEAQRVWLQCKKIAQAVSRARNESLYLGNPGLTTQLHLRDVENLQGY